MLSETGVSVPRSANGSVTLTALESLASWQRVSVAEAARQLMALDEHGRLQLQQEYARAHRR